MGHTVTGLLLMAAAAAGAAGCAARVPLAPPSPAAISRTANPGALNPLRFSAAEIRRDGDIWRLHGHVVVKFAGSLIVYTEDADYGSCALCPALPGVAPALGPQHALTTHGDARLAVQPVRAQPDLPFPVADARRFQAGEIRDEGGMMDLRGNVVMRMPGVRIYAQDAAFDKGTATITTHGDASITLLKALIVPSDNLGPEVIASSAVER
jgi:hypothetical protein